MISSYIHIPFCVSKCHYCDFNSVGLGKNKAPEAAYLQDLQRDLQAWCRILSSFARSSLATVFFGGGTPSLFSAEGIASILQALEEVAPLAPGAETTLELNPKTADQNKMRGFRQAGIRRLSMGIQTLEEELLKPLARAHSAAEALQALEWAFETGFPQINIDLMYALPGQTMSQLRDTLQKLEKFPLRHLSAYELIWEEGTPFYDLSLQGKLSPASEDLALQMRGELEVFALQRGMQPYEISNFAFEGDQSRHNLQYWDYGSFFGAGAGAVSFLKAEEISEEAKAVLGFSEDREIYGLRLTRPKGLEDYSRSVESLKGFEVEWISPETAMGEFWMMGLRKTCGIRFADFEKKFHRSLPEIFQKNMVRASKAAWMEVDEEGCRLTEAGMLVSNEILQGFIAEG